MLKINARKINLLQSVVCRCIPEEAHYVLLKRAILLDSCKKGLRHRIKDHCERKIFFDKRTSPLNASIYFEQ